MSTVITPFQETDPFSTATFNNRISQINTGFSYVSNSNLLDNWYFGNPVDQRQGRVVVPNTTYYSNNTLTTSAGTTSAYVTAYRYATGTVNGVNYASFKLTDSDTAPTYYAAPENVIRGYIGKGYNIDRWWCSNNNGILTLEDSFIKITGTNASAHAYLRHEFESSLLETMTWSVIAKGSGTFLFQANNAKGVVASCSTQTLTDKWKLYTWTFTPSDEISQYCLRVHNTSIMDVLACKAELGTVQTLAHQDEDGNWVLNELPNYADTLARCQRYLQKLVLIRSFAVSLDANGGYLTIQLPVAMRASPTITPISLGGIIGSDKSSTITKVRTVGFDGHNLTLMFKTSTTMAGNTAPVGYLYDTQVWLSAEL